MTITPGTTEVEKITLGGETIVLRRVQGGLVGQRRRHALGQQLRLQERVTDAARTARAGCLSATPGTTRTR